jgi:hypothetical protein
MYKLFTKYMEHICLYNICFSVASAGVLRILRIFACFHYALLYGYVGIFALCMYVHMRFIHIYSLSVVIPAINLHTYRTIDLPAPEIRIRSHLHTRESMYRNFIAITTDYRARRTEHIRQRMDAKYTRVRDNVRTTTLHSHT